MNNEWNSEEIKHDYPKYWNKGPFSYHFTETEELMIEKARKKILADKQEEKMTARERIAKNFYTNDAVDRIPICSTGVHTSTPRLFDSFADPPGTLSFKDMMNHPNLDLIGQMLWAVKFQTDFLIPYNYGFGEELMTRKFRQIENGPPLGVEPFAKTMEDAKWFLENVPDPAIRSATWPICFWEAETLIKIMPELPYISSCCGGQITSAGFFRGIKEFVMDIRNNFEMAHLVLKCCTAMLFKKADRMMEIMGQQMDESGQGNFILWCDATSYLSAEEFQKVLDITYKVSVPYVAEQGYSPFIVPEGPLSAHEKINAVLNENLGGGINAFIEHPALEEWYAVTRKHDNIVAMVGNGTDYMLKGPLAIDTLTERMKKVVSSADTKGQRTMFVQNAEPTAPLANEEYFTKKVRECSKYPH